MEDPTNQDIYKSIFKIIGILNQVIKQIEDLQDLIAEQKHTIDIQQDTLNKFLNKFLEPSSKIIPLHVAFIFKKKNPHPDIKIDKPRQKKDITFWLPSLGDCNSIGGMN